MKSTILMTLIFVFASCLVYGQEYEDVIYLKNGGQIHGIIIEQIPGESVKIKTKDGSIFVYKMEEIEKMTKEELMPKEESKIKTEFKERYMGRPVKNAVTANPLGFVQFGPILMGEMKIMKDAVATLHVRFHGLGLLSYMVASLDDDDLELSPASMGIGLGFKYFPDNESSANRWYLGIFSEYIFGETDGGHDKGYWEIPYFKYVSEHWEGEFQYVSLVSNFGYRFRTSSNIVFNVGLLAGGAFPIKDEWKYTDENHPDYGTTFTEEKFIFFGMLELGIGYEF